LAQGQGDTLVVIYVALEIFRTLSYTLLCIVRGVNAADTIVVLRCWAFYRRVQVSHQSCSTDL